MKSIPSRYLWLAIALVSAGLVAGSLILVAWLKLQPCPLCIFQRLLFMIMSVLAFTAFFCARIPLRRAAGVLTLFTAISGAGVAAYHVWLQAQPAAKFMCGAGDPNLIERLVDWLGQRVPFLFLSTGMCQDHGVDNPGSLAGSLGPCSLRSKRGGLSLGADGHAGGSDRQITIPGSGRPANNWGFTASDHKAEQETVARSCLNFRCWPIRLKNSMVKIPIQGDPVFPPNRLPKIGAVPIQTPVFQHHACSRG